MKKDNQVPILLKRNQYRLLDAIRRYWQANGFAPSYRELKIMTNIRSTSHIKLLLDDLEDKGIIHRLQGAARTITLVDGSHKKLPDQMLGANDQALFGVPWGTP